MIILIPGNRCGCDARDSDPWIAVSYARDFSIAPQYRETNVVDGVNSWRPVNSPYKETSETSETRFAVLARLGPFFDDGFFGCVDDPCLKTPNPCVGSTGRTDHVCVSGPVGSKTYFCECAGN